MIKKTDIFSKALVWGFFLSALHLAWVIFILLGWAQPLINFIFTIHMLNVPVTVQPFNFLYAITLVCITFVVGTFYGFIFYSVKKKISK
jgi:hypothetical protein